MHAERIDLAPLLFWGCMAAFFVTDLWLYLTGRQTMSQWFQQLFKGHVWRMVFAWAFWLALGWHMVHGFPWKLPR